MTVPTPRRLALPALIALGAVVVLYKLGASSYFIDEANSIAEVRGSVSHLWDGVRGIEASPATYFFGLHYWLSLTGGTSEWIARLPSALAAIALVPATWRLGELFAPGSWAAPLAALLSALSPLVLQYAQQARPYAPLILALAVTGIAVIEARRRASARWLAFAALAAAIALSLHYFAILIVLPLSVWLLRGRTLPVRWRLGYVGVVGAVFLAWLPLADEQYAHGGVGAFGNLTLTHVLVVVGSPFWGRSGVRASVLEPLGAAIVLAALVTCALPAVRQRVRDWGLLVALVALPLLALIITAAAGKDVLVNRWAAVVAPFAFVAIAIALISIPRRLPRIAAGAVVLGVCAVGIVKSDRPAGFYADARGALRTVRDGAGHGDVVAYIGRIGIFSVVSVYAHQLVPHLPLLAPNAWADPAQLTAYTDAVRRGRRIWIVVDDSPGQTPQPVSALVPSGYRLLAQTGLVADEDMRVLLASR